MSTEPIHRSNALQCLFYFNVMLAAYVYVSFFIQVIQLPFQAMLLPSVAGPGWLYLTVLVVIQIEYFQWPFEVMNYLFRPYDEQIKLIIDPANLDRWQRLSMIWGGIWSGLGFMVLAITLGVTDVATYIVSPLFYTVTICMYALQNWMFYTYLTEVGESEVYAEEKTEGGFLSRDVKIKTQTDKSKNPYHLIII